MKIKKMFSALIVIVATVSLVPAGPASRDGRQLEGTWVVTVSITAPGFPPSFTALETYSRGGGLVTSNNLPPVPRPGQGTWENDGNQYSVTVLFFTFDQSGVQNGSIKVRHRLRLAGQDEFSGVGQADFFDAQGNLLASVPFTSQARRLAVEQP